MAACTATPSAPLPMPALIGLSSAAASSKTPTAPPPLPNCGRGLIEFAGRRGDTVTLEKDLISYRFPAPYVSVSPRLLCEGHDDRAGCER